MPVAQSNGIEIDYEVHGEGEPLVLIMGFSAQRIVWPQASSWTSWCATGSRW
jgi:hypothetical protein